MVYSKSDKDQLYPIRDENERPDEVHEKNLAHLIINKMKLQVGFDVIRQTITINGRAYRDADLSRIVARGRSERLTKSKDHYYDVIVCLAEDNKFNPVQTLIETNPWDGRDRIQELLDTVITTDKLHWEFTARRWLIGYVARAVSLGEVDVSGVLVLQGGQGEGKSKWTKKLCPWEDLQCEKSINPESKDDQFRRANNILWNISELDRVTRKADVAALKDFLTATDSTVRRPYERADTHVTNVCSFVASVNPDDFLRDETGNRRFLVNTITEIDYMHEIDMVQVFAQAYALYLAGEKTWFDKEDIKRLEIVNANYKPEVEYSRIAYYTVKTQECETETMQLWDELYAEMGLRESKPSFPVFRSNLLRMGYTITKSYGKYRSKVNARMATEAEAQENMNKRRLKVVAE